MRQRAPLAMQKLKSLGQAIASFIKRVGLLPQSVAMAINHRREQVVLDKCEAERLDRIRNPSKYRGK
jgi:hypothetical protein